MATYQMEALMANRHLKVKESWEQTRFLAFVMAQVNSKKKLKPEDLLKFPWDEGGKNGKEQKKEVTDEEVAALREKTARMEKLINHI